MTTLLRLSSHDVTIGKRGRKPWPEEVRNNGPREDHPHGTATIQAARLQLSESNSDVIGSTCQPHWPEETSRVDPEGRK